MLSKKGIKQFGFFFETGLFEKNWWNTGYLWLFWKEFSTDQYILGRVNSFINFFDKRKKYLCLDASIEAPRKFWRDLKFSDCCLLKHLYVSFLSWIRHLIDLLIQGGSLSSHVIILYGIKLCYIMGKKQIG